MLLSTEQQAKDGLLSIYRSRLELLREPQRQQQLFSALRETKDALEEISILHLDLQRGYLNKSIDAYVRDIETKLDDHLNVMQTAGLNVQQRVAIITFYKELMKIEPRITDISMFQTMKLKELYCNRYFKETLDDNLALAMTVATIKHGEDGDCIDQDNYHDNTVYTIAINIFHQYPKAIEELEKQGKTELRQFVNKQCQKIFDKNPELILDYLSGFPELIEHIGNSNEAKHLLENYVLHGLEIEDKNHRAARFYFSDLRFTISMLAEKKRTDLIPLVMKKYEKLHTMVDDSPDDTLLFIVTHADAVKVEEYIQDIVTGKIPVVLYETLMSNEWVNYHQANMNYYLTTTQTYVMTDGFRFERVQPKIPQTEAPLPINKWMLPYDLAKLHESNKLVKMVVEYVGMQAENERDRDKKLLEIFDRSLVNRNDFKEQLLEYASTLIAAKYVADEVSS